MFFYQINVLNLKRYSQAAGSMLSSTVSSSIFSFMLTNDWTTSCTVVLMIIFASILVHVIRNVTMALNKVKLFFFVGQGFFSFIGAVIRLLDLLQNDFFESLVYYVFSRRLFQVAKIEYGLVSIFGLPEPFRLV